MKPKEVKKKININRIVEFIDDFSGNKLDYIQDSDGNHIFPVNPLEYKIIERVYSNYNKNRKVHTKKLKYIHYTYNIRLKELEDLKQILIDCVTSSGNWNSFRTCLQARLGL